MATLEEDLDNLDANVTIGLDLLGPETNKEAVEAGFDAGKASMRALLAVCARFPDSNEATITIIEQMFCSSLIASLAHCLGPDVALGMVRRMLGVADALVVLESPQEPMPEGTVAH